MKTISKEEKQNRQNFARSFVFPLAPSSIIPLLPHCHDSPPPPLTVLSFSALNLCSSAISWSRSHHTLPCCSHQLSSSLGSISSPCPGYCPLPPLCPLSSLFTHTCTLLYPGSSCTSHPHTQGLSCPPQAPHDVCQAKIHTNPNLAAHAYWCITLYFFRITMCH